ncbi:MAG: SMP-30/gluconolactonase/LRE family protein [Pseudomonadales bacterium]
MNVPTPRTLIGPGHGLRFTESPRWRGDRLWFIDIHDSAIKSVSLAGDLRTEISLSFKPNGLGFRRDGSVVFSDALHLRMKRWDGAVAHDLADLDGIAVFCLSDALVDAHDRVYVSDIGYNFWNPAIQPVDTCVIARIDPDGAVTRVADGLQFPNGLVITPDGRTLIIAETNDCRLTAFDIARDGSLSNRRVFAQLPEGTRPDGICLDAEGAVWVANPSGNPAVLRVTGTSDKQTNAFTTVTHRLDLDSHAYAVMLGGPERRHLFICTSASHDPAEIAERPTAQLLVAEVDIPGAGMP